ncbi:MAG: hypothetical protein CBC42_00030 [Betaproteobacteria bacterium TMED82]|nr:MAG: hypothetical protein CBC42_00030 [Betaproteobacteria bacterium TMED82]|tara:strand:- start:15596 stop:17683 length:2088 start_codon:yes stop_codon:yes gene_type:complete
MTSHNFFSRDEIPTYSQLTPGFVAENLETLISDTNIEINRILNSPEELTYASTINRISCSTEKIHRLWGATNHLAAVMDSEEWRILIDNKIPLVSNFFSEFSQNEKLFNLFHILKEKQGIILKSSEKKVIANYIKEFTLGGINLNVKDKSLFKKHCLELSELSKKFSENLLDSTKISYLHISLSSLIDNPNKLAGVPQHLVQSSKKTALSKNLDGHVFTLLMPSYIPALQYAEDRDLRFNLYSKNSRRASKLSDEGSQFDNSPVLASILRTRYKQARLLGFKNPAEMYLYSKMANSPEEVISFLKNLSKKARPSAERELDRLKSFASSKFSLEKIEPWDIPFVSEKLKESLFSFSNEDLRDFFPLERVTRGLFETVSELFNCKIRDVTKKHPDKVWHNSVQLFELYDGNKLIGHLFMDLFARDTKRGGAWMDESRSRRIDKNNLQTPIALINCNFSLANSDDNDSYLTHEEVLTLFHEFGHALHHLLTEVSEIEVSGINGVEWDAVELPSQFLENFAWEYATLKKISAHKNDGRYIPEALFRKIIDAKNFNSGLQMLRQVEFALFDILIHYKLESAQSPSDRDIFAEVDEILDGVRAEISIVPYPDFLMFPNSFSHIFDGGYAAGYYSYKWAEVLSADCYSKFENQSQESRGRLGQKFRSEILSQGGSRDTIDSFRGFMDRNPEMEALLRHSGLT